MIPFQIVRRFGHGLTCEQEFSIEIPDKEADAIHSGMSSILILGAISFLTPLTFVYHMQSSKLLAISSRNPMVGLPF